MCGNETQTKHCGGVCIGARNRSGDVENGKDKLGNETEHPFLSLKIVMDTWKMEAAIAKRCMIHQCHADFHASMVYDGIDLPYLSQRDST